MASNIKPPHFDYIKITHTEYIKINVIFPVTNTLFNLSNT